jgi:hypothetical protein
LNHAWSYAVSTSAFTGSEPSSVLKRKGDILRYRHCVGLSNGTAAL